LILESYNTPFELKEIATPVPGHGQVLVKIKASGVNPLDLKIVAGAAGHAQTRLPAILGIDLAGVVEAVGKGVTQFEAGDEVYGMTGGIAGVPGSLAQYAAVDADLLALKPRNLSMREAAALPLNFITAWEALVDRAHVGFGKTVLVHGGAGGVGNLAVQLAKAKGATVFATVSPEKAALVESHGAIAIDHTRLGVEEYMLAYTNEEGFDIILDTVGGSVLDASFKAVRRYTGHVVSILGWGTHSLAPLSFRGASYSGVFTLYPLISGKGRAHHGDILREATLLAEAGEIKPLINSHVYTFSTIGEAYRAVADRKINGKVIIGLDERFLVV
jgi:NADPH2:quinone reductase